MVASNPKSWSDWYDIPWEKRIVQTVRRIHDGEIQSMNDIPTGTMVPYEDFIDTLYAFDFESRDRAETVVEEVVETGTLEKFVGSVIRGDSGFAVHPGLTEPS